MITYGNWNFIAYVEIYNEYRSVIEYNEIVVSNNADEVTRATNICMFKKQRHKETYVG